MTDIKFKEKLAKDPKTIFVDMGDMREDSDWDIRILEDTKEVKNVILPSSPINNDQLDMYKSKVAYLWGWSRGAMSDCDDPRAMLYVDCDGYAPYDTTIRIECTSKPTCM